MIDTLTSFLGLSQPNFDGSADVRVINADLAVIDAAANRNLLVNPGFEVWQRGTGAFTGSGVYAADRWQTSNGAGSSQSVSRDATLPDASSAYCAAVTYTHVTGASNLTQKLEDYQQLRGRTLVFACRVRASVAGAARAAVFDGTSWTYSGYHSGSGGYETLSVAVAIPAGASSVSVGVWYQATGTYYLDNATLHIGSSPVPYAPLLPSEDLARCMRYYEVVGAVANMRYAVGQVATATTFLVVLPYKVRKAVAPTVTVAGATSMLATNAATGTIALTGLTPANATVDTVQLSGVVAAGLVAGNATLLLNDGTATGAVAIEANP